MAQQVVIFHASCRSPKPYWQCTCRFCISTWSSSSCIGHRPMFDFGQCTPHVFDCARADQVCPRSSSGFLEDGLFVDFLTLRAADACAYVRKKTGLVNPEWRRRKGTGRSGRRAWSRLGNLRTWRATILQSLKLGQHLAEILRGRNHLISQPRTVEAHLLPQRRSAKQNRWHATTDPGGGRLTCFQNLNNIDQPVLHRSNS